MKLYNPIISVVIAGVILGFLRKALYFCTNLSFKYLESWAAISLLATLGVWLLFQMVQAAVLTVPLKQFRAESPLPSYLAALWIIATSVKMLVLFDPLKYPHISFTVFSIIQALEIIVALFALTKVSKLAKLNQDISAFRK